VNMTSVCLWTGRSCGRCTASLLLHSASLTPSLTSTLIRPSWTSGVASLQAFFSFSHIPKWFVCFLLHRVSKKNSQNCFWHNFVKFPPTLIIFCTTMVKTILLCTVHLPPQLIYVNALPCETQIL